jgi:D-amino peptidase
MNKYLLSVDIEGITGVAGKTFATQNGKHYEMARRYMAHDVNAVVEGILEADPTAWIVVKDAHDTYAVNLDLERLHPQANLMQGWGNNLNMLDPPLDNSYKDVYLVGYHAGGDNLDAVLGHMYSSVVHEVKVNDLVINETGIAALYAGHRNVPIAFISGDNHVMREARKQLQGIDFVGVVVKESYGRDCALSLSLERAQESLFNGAKEATVKLLEDKVAPFKMATPLKVAVKLYNIGFGASIFMKVQGVLGFDQSYQFERENFTIRYLANSQQEMVDRFTLIMSCVYAAKAGV